MSAAAEAGGGRLIPIEGGQKATIPCTNARVPYVKDAPPTEGADRAETMCVKRPTPEWRRCEEVFRHQRDPPINTSTLYQTYKLPDRFERPHVFQGYGCQVHGAIHPLYQTTSNDYGWYTPSCHTVSPQFHPKSNAFSELLRRTGMYRNYSLNTAMDSAGCGCWF